MELHNYLLIAISTYWFENRKMLLIRTIVLFLVAQFITTKVAQFITPFVLFYENSGQTRKQHHCNISDRSKLEYQT